MENSASWLHLPWNKGCELSDSQQKWWVFPNAELYLEWTKDRTKKLWPPQLLIWEAPDRQKQHAELTFSCAGRCLVLERQTLCVAQISSGKGLRFWSQILGPQWTHIKRPRTLQYSRVHNRKAQVYPYHAIWSDQGRSAQDLWAGIYQVASPTMPTINQQQIPQVCSQRFGLKITLRGRRE